MQTSAHFVAQAFFDKYRQQGKVNDRADSQYHGRPGDMHWLKKHMTDEKFQRHTEQGDLDEQAKSPGQDGEGKFACKESKNLHQSSDQRDNRKPQLPEPGIRWRQKSDHIQINSHRYAVRQQGNIDGCLTVYTAGKVKTNRQIQIPITRRDHSELLKDNRFNSRQVTLVAIRTTESKMPRSFRLTTSTCPLFIG